MRSLCLTSRALVPRCRRYIFREVKFDHSSAWGSGFTYPRHNSSRVQAFLFLLTERGSEALGAPIGHYVQLLRIENNSSPLIPHITARLPSLKNFIVISSLRACDVALLFDYEVLHEVTEGKVEEYDQDTRAVLLASKSVQPVIQRVRNPSYQPFKHASNFVGIAQRRQCLPMASSGDVAPREASHQTETF